ncbi:MAG: prokaryotic n-terminal methylation site [Akkermansiaceae bacterium]|nr:prokaryotic n-terminal methylation site [Akkermansiaceae bacterium]
MSGILWLGGGCAGLLLLAMLIVPRDLRGRRGGDRVEAINNIKQVGVALQEFDSEYGCFPNDATAVTVKADSTTALTLGGSSSNSYFRQLIATGLKSEKSFYAKRAGGKRSDDLLADDAHALSPGECGFAYIVGLSGSMDPSTPIVMTPMIGGTTRFDPSPFDGKAVVLFLDNSARALPLDSSGRAILNGMDLFDPRQPFWRGKAPDLRWPE